MFGKGANKCLKMLAVAAAAAALLVLGAVPDTGYAYNRPWDQGHDGTNPNDPNNPNNPNRPPNNPCGGSGSPILLQTGEFNIGYIDMALQACGMPIKITRVYDSFDEHDGLFGYGWSLSYGIRLFPSRDVQGQEYVVALMPNGQRYQYDKNLDGTYAPPPGTVFTLVKNGAVWELTDNIDLTYTFDANGFMTQVADRAGNTVRLTYTNFAGCIASIQDQNGRALTFTYGVNGKIASITDPAGNTMNYAYDANGNLITVTDPEGSVMHYTYDGMHHLTGVTNNDGVSLISVTYQNTEPYKVTQYKEGGETWNITYVSTTQTNKTNSQGRTFQFVYDANGLVTQVTSPLGHVTGHTYDAAYNYDLYTNENGGVTDFDHDADRNLIQVKDPLQQAYILTYDGDNNVTDITDPLGRQGTFAYDQDSNLTQVHLPIGGNPWIASYDTEGYLTQLKQGGDQLDFTRDNDCNLATISAGANQITLGYDDLGNVTSITGPAGNRTYTYNGRNQISRVTDGQGQTDLGYDANGRLATVTYPDATVMAFQYANPTGYSTNTPTLTRITYQDGTFFQYDFWPFGKLKSVTDELGQTKNFAYDNDQRLTGVTFPSGKTVNYTYDNGQNVTQIQDSVLGNLALTYDADNRLTSISDGATLTVTFQYDAVGNRTAKIDGNTAQTTAYVYDAVNRLTTAGGQAVNPPAARTARNISLNDALGLYNTRQNVRLLSFLVQRTPDETVDSLSALTLEYNKYQNGIPETLTTGFSAFSLPYVDLYSMPGALPLMDFLDTYKRLGLGW